MADQDDSFTPEGLAEADKLQNESWWKLWKRSVTPGAVSSTKLVYTWAGICGGISLVILALSFAGVYILTKDHLVNGVFATAMGGIATALFGFASNSQNKKAEADKAVAIATGTGKPANPAGGTDVKPK